MASINAPMLRRLSLGLLASAVSLTSLPAITQEGSADVLGVMSISLSDVVKPTIGFQGALQVQAHQIKQALVVSFHCLLGKQRLVL
jgi:hypothetical protein